MTPIRQALARPYTRLIMVGPLSITASQGAGSPLTTYFGTPSYADPSDHTKQWNAPVARLSPLDVVPSLYNFSFSGSDGALARVGFDFYRGDGTRYPRNPCVEKR